MEVLRFFSTEFKNIMDPKNKTTLERVIMRDEQQLQTHTHTHTQIFFKAGLLNLTFQRSTI